VVSRLEHDDIVTFDQIDESMFFVNSARPTPRKNVSKRLRFADAFERVTYGVFEEPIETFERCLIVGLPMAIVLPAQRSEDQSHQESL
jgi:hypothetical protein